MTRIVLRAMNQICLPISETTPFIDKQRPSADVPLMRLPHRLFEAVGDTWPALKAKVRLPALPLAVDPAIDRFVTHWPEISRTRHVAGNLLWREMRYQKLLDM